MRTTVATLVACVLLGQATGTDQRYCPYCGRALPAGPAGAGPPAAPRADADFLGAPPPGAGALTRDMDRRYRLGPLREVFLKDRNAYYRARQDEDGFWVVPKGFTGTKKALRGGDRVPVGYSESTLGRRQWAEDRKLSGAAGPDAEFVDGGPQPPPSALPRE